MENYTGAPLSSGDRIEYTITVSNSGDGSASNLSVQGLVPPTQVMLQAHSQSMASAMLGTWTTVPHSGLDTLAAGESAVIVLQVEIDSGLPADAAWITSAVITDYDESSDSAVSDNDPTAHCGIVDDGYDHALDADVYTNDDDATKLPLMQGTVSESCILAFEDLKNRGWNDWDMNDLVLVIASYYTLDANNDVEAVFVTYHVIARGAAATRS